MTSGNHRSELVQLGASLFARGLAYGRTGNISVRTTEGFIVTPTGVALGELDPQSLPLVTLEGMHVAGASPSKEAFLHAAFYRARPDVGAVVHLHCANATAVSCLQDINPDDVLPPLTSYYVMRVGRLRLIPFFVPGDPTLGPVAEKAAKTSRALLLANHGPIVGGEDLASAADAIEELEMTAGIYLRTMSMRTRILGAGQVDAVVGRFRLGR